MSNKENNMVLNEITGGELIVFLRERKKIDLDLDEDDVSDSQAVQEIVEGFFEFAASKLAENKSKTETVSFEVPGFVSMEVNYREGEGDGNWGVGCTLGEEFKKPIKLLDDGDGDEEDE